MKKLLKKQVTSNVLKAVFCSILSLSMAVSVNCISVFSNEAIVHGADESNNITWIPEALPVIASYDFENGLEGMSDTGYGTAPEIVQDAEKGNVLMFHDGVASEYQSQMDNPALSESSTDIVINSPSSLKLDENPFAGRDLKGATISMWVKAPKEAAEEGSGLVGFVSTKRENILHPDYALGIENGEDNISGYYAYGIGTAAHDFAFMTGNMVYFGGFLRNTMWYLDADQTFLKNADKWTHMIVTIGNNMDDNAVYINGVLASGGELGIGKRFNHGEENGGNPGNTDQPLMMEILTDITTSAYLGYTGSMGTVEGVCIDDLTYYSRTANEMQIKEIYENAMEGTGNLAKEIFYGDMDADTFVEAEDALTILKLVVKLESSTEIDFLERADVDHNGKVEAADALQALEVVVSLRNREIYR